jgi:hypothetical protein
MFDHVRGDQLDQHKYPWLTLTQGAIYLISPDDAERVRAIIFHDWARPFKRLHKWIEDGKLTVYDGWNEPYEPIPKEDFFGVWIRYPSYPDDRQEDIRRAYQPGFRAFIDCDLSWPRNRYFEARKYEPKWRDLKIQSQELVAIALEINGQTKSDKGQQDLRGMPKDMSKFYEPWPDYEWLAALAGDRAKPAAGNSAASTNDEISNFVSGYIRDNPTTASLSGCRAKWKTPHGAHRRDELDAEWRKQAKAKGLLRERGQRVQIAKS